jgi:membrane protease YdiL (CAAX protease family)
MASGAPGSGDGEPRPSPPQRAPVPSWSDSAVAPIEPATRRDAGAWLVCAGMGFVVGQVASAILLELVAAATGHGSDVWRLASRASPPAWVVVTELVGLWGGFVGAAYLASRAWGSGRLWRDMGLAVRLPDIAIGVATGLLGQLLLLPLLYLPLEHTVPNLDQRLKEPAQHLTGGFPGADIAVISVLTVVVVPVVEELFFRGLVLRGLMRALRGAGPVIGTAGAAVLTGVVFGLAHFELLELLGLSAFGAVLALMAYRFRRLGPGIFAHGMFNLLAVLSVAGILH